MAPEYTARRADGLSGKVIAGVTSDTGEHVAYIVSDAHSVALQNVAKLLAAYNGRTVRLTIETVDA